MGLVGADVWTTRETAKLNEAAQRFDEIIINLEAYLPSVETAISNEMSCVEAGAKNCEDSFSDVIERTRALLLRSRGLAENDIVLDSHFDQLAQLEEQIFSALAGRAASGTLQSSEARSKPQHVDLTLLRAKVREIRHIIYGLQTATRSSIESSYRASMTTSAAGGVLGIILLWFFFYRSRRHTRLLERQRDVIDEHEKRTQFALAVAGMGAWDVDLKSGVAVWSESCFRILGYEPAPTRQATLAMWQARVVPEDLERVMGEMERARTSHDMYRAENRVI
jgi:PAS domain-containing protein